MKISKARIKHLIAESVRKVLKEEDEAQEEPVESETTEAGLDAKHDTLFYGHYGYSEAIANALKPATGKGGVTEDQLKSDFAMFEDSAGYILVSRKDKNYQEYMRKSADNIDPMKMASFSISDKDIEEAKEAHPKRFKTGVKK